MALRAARYARPSAKRRAAERAAIVEAALSRVLLGIAEKQHPAFERYNWRKFARPEQIMPAGDWYTWILMAGRGFGKNRTGAEAVRELVHNNPGSHGALTARTAADVRDTMLGNPGSGLMEVFPPSERPLWEPSKRRLTFGFGTYATTYSAEEPDSLRGPQHHWGWGDEVSTWRYAAALENLRLGLRLPLVWPTPTPRLIVTMTPRTTKTVKELLRPAPEVEALGKTILTRGRTADNLANLAPNVVALLYARYAGTRLERQELEGELVEDVDGALFRREVLEITRAKWWTGSRDDGGALCQGDHDSPLEVAECGAPVHLERSVVAVDPGGSGEDNDPTAIAVVGLGDDGHWYIIEAVALRVSPEEWAKRAIWLLDRWNANYIVAETNHGGEMVASTLRAQRPAVPFKGIHAKKGKALRAEPVSLLADQGRVHMVGYIEVAEEQLVAFTGYNVDDGDPTGGHFDVVDAVVYGVLELSEGQLHRGAVYPA